jgi:hypothetical protein
VARQAAWIMSDGTIRATDGTSLLKFYHTPVSQMFPVVYHRNHLAVMSANSIILSGGIYPYDFSSGAGQVFGNTAGTLEMVPGIWGMIAGDGNTDGTVDNTDRNIWNSEAGNNGYLQSDFNLNGQTDNPDKNDFWHINLGRSSQIPD